MLVPTATCGGNLKQLTLGGINAPPPIPNRPVKIPMNSVATNANKGGT